MEDAVAVINAGRDEAVGECGGSVSGDRSGGDVELDVISVAMEAETVMAYVVARGKHVEMWMNCCLLLFHLSLLHLMLFHFYSTVFILMLSSVSN